MAIKDVVTGISDGLPLIALMEILSEKNFAGKIDKKAASRVQKIDNANRALDFVKTCGISMKMFPSAEGCYFFRLTLTDFEKTSSTVTKRMFSVSSGRLFFVI